MTETIDQLLDSARREGQLESQGTFTLDFQKAVDKLRGFQVSDPYSYLNRLIRAAGASGATRVCVKTTATSTLVEFNAVPCAPERLSDLFEQMLVRENPAAQDFSTALNIALALRPTSIQVRLQDARVGTLLSLAIAEKEGEPRPQVQLFQTRPADQDGRSTSVQIGWPFQSSFTRSVSDTPETLAVVQRFRFSPMSILLNGKQLEVGSGWGGVGSKPWRLSSSDTVRLGSGFLRAGSLVSARHHLLEIRAAREASHRNDFSVGPPLAMDTIVLGSADPTGFPGRLALAVAVGADARRPSRATFLWRGEVLQAFPVELGLPGLQMLLSAEGLELDLTGEKLREDERFEVRWSEARTVALNLKEALIRAYGRLKNLQDRIYLERRDLQSECSRIPFF